jgi:hypothetical protein
VALLAGFFLRDLYHEDPADFEGPEKTVEEAPVDPQPRVAARFNEERKFGLVMLEGGENKEVKKLTYSDDGGTNNTCVRIDGKDFILGDDASLWQGPNQPPGKDRTGRERAGGKSVYAFSSPPIRVTQHVEVVPGELAAGQSKRLLDTCLVRYTLENRDDRPHAVGLRFELDTYIGSNDGVPFTVPGQAALCRTRQDFTAKADIPDFIQALENPDLQHPGTVAHLTVKVGGGLDAPDRVSLTHWKGDLKEWEVPMADIGSDSAVVLYWGERELAPGATREVGFAYGLGSVSSAEGGGRLGLTVGGSLRPGDAFTVTAYVRDPAPGQTVTLRPGSGLELAEGTAAQTVPPLPAGAASRNSPVTWKVRAARPGRYSLRVELSTGEAQTQAVTIRKSSALFD